ARYVNGDIVQRSPVPQRVQHKPRYNDENGRVLCMGDDIILVCVDLPSFSLVNAYMSYVRIGFKARLLNVNRYVGVKILLGAIFGTGSGAETDTVHPQVLDGGSRAVVMDKGKRADKGMSKGTYKNNNFKPAASHRPREADEQHRLLQALALEWMYEKKIPRPEYS
ncbi:hypothetical protein Tco_0404922, partial [Tanacetum coccineum]